MDLAELDCGLEEICLGSCELGGGLGLGIRETIILDDECGGGGLSANDENMVTSR